jgi:hypothetical protein
LLKGLEASISVSQCKQRQAIISNPDAQWGLWSRSEPDRSGQSPHHEMGLDFVALGFNKPAAV